MNVGIIGYGLQGKSAAKYWHNKGAQITICDQNAQTEVPEWAQSKLGNRYLDSLDEYDVIIRSPSVHPMVLEKAGGLEILQKVTTTTNEFLRVCPTKNIIGVTGTKGKGTTSSLITEILRTAGKTVHLGGNIGTDPLEMLNDTISSDDWVVLELANFQLIDIKISPRIAVCLMVVPEHLNWHKDVLEYYWAKQQLFRYQTHTDITVLTAEIMQLLVWCQKLKPHAYLMTSHSHHSTALQLKKVPTANTMFYITKMKKCVR